MTGQSYTIDIDERRKCPQCGKGGATVVDGKPGVCMDCGLKNIEQQSKQNGKMTIEKLVALTGMAALSIDSNRWELANLAVRARDDGLLDYPYVIGNHPRVRRSHNTVRHWARTADFRNGFLTIKDGDLTYSIWETASRYEGKLSHGDMQEFLETAAAEGVTVEEFKKTLDELTGREPELREKIKRLRNGIYGLVDLVSQEAKAHLDAAADSLTDAEAQLVKELSEESDSG